MIRDHAADPNRPRPPASAASAESTVGASDDDRAFLTDGAALGASAVLTALVGLLGWLLAARLLEPAQVGRASAFVNAFVLVAGVAELGLGQACLKWLPSAGEHTRTVLGRVYAGVLASAVLVSLLWGLVTRDALREQMGTGTLAAVLLFVAAGVSWTVFHVQDFVLTSLRAARWVPVENISFGVVRIVLLVVLAQLYGSLGIVLSWVVPTALAALVVTTVLMARRRRLDGVAGVLPERAPALRLAGSIYLSTIGITLMTSLVPLAVTARLGPAVGAVFFIIWNGVAAIELAAAGFGSALVVRLTGDSMALLHRSLRQVVPLFAVPLAIAAAAAGPLLHLFGEQYADEGTVMLRWVCLGLIVRLVGVMVVAIHLEAGRTARLVLVNTGTAVAILLAVALVPFSGSLAVLGLAYVVIQVAVVSAAVLDLWSVSRRERRRTGA